MVLVENETSCRLPCLERFALLEDPKTVPFCWLQSLEEPNIALIVMNPFQFMPDYKLDLDGFIAAKDWKGVKTEELQIYVVVNISEGEKGKKITANLLGPLVINSKTNEVFQVVIPDSIYSYQHNILDA